MRLRYLDVDYYDQSARRAGSKYQATILHVCELRLPDLQQQVDEFFAGIVLSEVLQNAGEIPLPGGLSKPNRSHATEHFLQNALPLKVEPVSIEYVDHEERERGNSEGYRQPQLVPLDVVEFFEPMGNTILEIFTSKKEVPVEVFSRQAVTEHLLERILPTKLEVPTLEFTRDVPPPTPKLVLHNLEPPLITDDDETNSGDLCNPLSIANAMQLQPVELEDPTLEFTITTSDHHEQLLRRFFTEKEQPTSLGSSSSDDFQEMSDVKEKLPVLLELPMVYDEDSCFRLSCDPGTLVEAIGAEPVDLDFSDGGFTTVASEMYTRLILLPELSLASHLFKMLPVPTFDDASAAGESVFEAIAATNKLVTSSSATDFLYFDWHLSQANNCNNQQCFLRARNVDCAPVKVPVPELYTQVSGVRTTPEKVRVHSDDRPETDDGPRKDAPKRVRTSPEKVRVQSAGRSETEDGPRKNAPERVRTSPEKVRVQSAGRPEAGYNGPRTEVPERKIDAGFLPGARNLSSRTPPVENRSAEQVAQGPSRTPSPRSRKLDFGVPLSDRHSDREFMQGGVKARRLDIPEAEWLKPDCPISERQSAGRAEDVLPGARNFGRPLSSGRSEDVRLLDSDLHSGALNVLKTGESFSAPGLYSAAQEQAGFVREGKFSVSALYSSGRSEEGSTGNAAQAAPRSRKDGGGLRVTIVANIGLMDKHGLTSRRQTYQKVLGLERSGGHVVEREMRLPVDLVLTPSWCLVLYSPEKLSILPGASIESIIEGIIDNDMKAISFCFLRCTMIFEGDVKFTSAVLQVVDDIYAAAVGLSIHVQCFVSASMADSDTIVLSCINQVKESVPPVAFPQMSDSETVAEAFLTEFPAVNPLTAHAILSCGMSISRFICSTHQDQVVATRSFDVPRHSLLLFKAQCEFGDASSHMEEVPKSSARAGVGAAYVEQQHPVYDSFQEDPAYAYDYQQDQEPEQPYFPSIAELNEEWESTSSGGHLRAPAWEDDVHSVRSFGTAGVGGVGSRLTAVDGLEDIGPAGSITNFGYSSNNKPASSSVETALRKWLETRKDKRRKSSGSSSVDQPPQSAHEEEEAPVSLKRSLSFAEGKAMSSSGSNKRAATGTGRAGSVNSDIVSLWEKFRYKTGAIAELPLLSSKRQAPPSAISFSKRTRGAGALNPKPFNP